MKPIHRVKEQWLDEELANDVDHCYCSICNHRCVETCIDSGCSCCVELVEEVAEK